MKIRYFDHLAHFQTHRHYIPNLFPHEMVAIPRHIAFQVGYPLDVEARAAAPAMTLETNLGIWGDLHKQTAPAGSEDMGQMMIS